MTRVIAGMTMSVDGFVADEFGRSVCLSGDLMRAVTDETGAVLMGRRTYEMDAHDEPQVPTFVVTHKPPEIDWLTCTFVTDGVEAAVARAKCASEPRGKVVTVVGGPNLVRQLLCARLVDELQVDVMPVFLGAGVRMFDGLFARGLPLVGRRTSLRFRVGM